MSFRPKKCGDTAAVSLLWLFLKFLNSLPSQPHTYQNDPRLGAGGLPELGMEPGAELGSNQLICSLQLCDSVSATYVCHVASFPTAGRRKLQKGALTAVRGEWPVKHACFPPQAVTSGKSLSIK